MRLCPACMLPVRRLGRVYAACSDDGTTAGVVGICSNCTRDEGILPHAIRGKRANAAITRGLERPGRYLVALFGDLGAAELAVGMLGCNDLASEVLEIIGWRDPGAGQIEDMASARAWTRALMRS